jgi:hypothetical protein
MKYAYKYPHLRDLFDYYGFKCQPDKKVIAVGNKIQYRNECELLDLDLGDHRASNVMCTQR